MLGHHIFADHSAGFADIEVERPVPRGGKFVLCETVFCDFVANFFGNAGVVLEEVEELLVVVEVRLEDFGAAFVGGFGPLVVAADEVGADCIAIVYVRFPVGDTRNDERECIGFRLEIAGGELEIVGVVALGLFDLPAVFGNFGKSEAEIVRLNLFVLDAVGERGL